MVRNLHAGYRKKIRDSKQRKTKHVLLIAAEGNNKTETNYFRNFNKDSVSVRFVSGNETEPGQLVRRLAEEAEAQDLQPDDLAVCLVDADFDVSKNNQLKKADQEASKARKKGFNLQLTVSSPCFEIWYLCYFSSSTRNYNSNKEILKELERYIPDYSKSQDVYKEYLQGNTALAVKNAKILEKHCLESGLQPHTVSFTPSTEVYKVFEEFLFQYLRKI
ncbi:RloB family protein [Acidaminococcus timonensis]|uniref:RloB family protein n=1 Tax=Acidaminococcus timonensis TaxID=1871002 RepID=UPI0026F0D82E|nr:RloB family protein [Acidaminococcus timonensis]